MMDLIGREVEVITPELAYRGVLEEVTEEEISIRAPNGWITIPMERVLDVRPVD